MAIIETPSYTVLCTYFALVGAIFSSFLYHILYDVKEHITLYHSEPLHGQYCKFLHFLTVSGLPFPLFAPRLSPRSFS
jgi:hypothetical protein